MAAMRTTPAAPAPRTPESRYLGKLRHRGRGIGDLERRVGNVCAWIDERLARRDVVRILELGCGYGSALLDLRARYGSRVDLHGINRVPGDGDRALLLRNAAERGLRVDDSVPDQALPTLAYGDVATGLPFGDDAFDLVVSQVAWLYFGNKIGVLREVMRVLAPDGLARIDADEMYPGLPAEYARLVEIWQDGRLVPFGDYLRRFGMALVPAPEGEYLRFGKVVSFGDDLVPVLEIDVSTLHGHWDGVKCVYAAARSPAPGSSR